MKLVSLENLPDNFRVSLDEDFRKKLFNKAREIVGTQKKLMREIGYFSYSGILGLIRGYIPRNKSSTKELVFIKVETLKKLSEITGTSLQEIESHITELKMYKKGIRTKLPIYASKELASVVGHAFGDGHIVPRFFAYWNKNRELIDEVKNNIKIAFSTDVQPREYKEGKDKKVFRIVFPASISKLLLLVGAPNGNKVTQTFKIPNWIENGSKEIKIAFIRALFDDEGNVDFGGKKGSNVSINLTKSKKLLDSHKEFLGDIQKLLSNVGVIGNKICKMGYSSGGQNVALGFGITGYQNFVNFLREISFTSTTKRNKLQKIVRNIKNITYRKGECGKLILDILKEGPRNVKYLMEKVNRTYNCVRSHLCNLHKQDLVYKEKIGKNVLWKLK